MTKKPSVAILTSLIDFNPAFSLTGIILNQAKMLERNGYDYTLYVLKNFNKEDQESYEAFGFPSNIEYILPSTHLIDYRHNQNPEPDFEKDVQMHFAGSEEQKTKGYDQVVQDHDVIITHDLMFLSWHLPQNAAIRKCVDKWPNKRWLHWIHSAPSIPAELPVYPSTLRFQGCDNSIYVYLNHRQKQDLANQLHITTEDIRVVYNPKDLRDELEFDPKTCTMVERADLLNHEILQVYPFSTPRWEAKGVKQLLRIWGYWSRMGLKAKLVLVNAHCTQEQDEVEVRKIEEYARKCDLSPGHSVLITSRLASEMEIEAPDDNWTELKYGVPFRIVQQLMQASNTFVFPSVSECCSLIQAEAAILGKFTVLNRNFLPMLEFASSNIHSYEFGNCPDNNPTYYECVARELWGDMQADATFMNSTKARCKTYNRDWIFKNQLQPLLYKGFMGL